MNFLVTGMNGFAGKHLVKLLNDHGNGVVPESIDITNKVDVDQVFRKERIDGVFNLAAKTHPPTSFEKPREYFNVNANGAINIIEAIRKYQPDCIMMQCSAGSVYGIHPEGTIITEETQCFPQDPYAVSKYAADLYTQERCSNGLLKGFIVRPFSHTGPGRPSNYSISSDAIQIARILKGKDKPVIRVGNLGCKRVVMDVRDIVDVYYRLMLRYIHGNEKEFGSVFNISGNKLRTIGEYLEIMIELVGLYDAKTEIDPLLYREFDIPIQYPDSEKVRKTLDWEPRIPIERTLLDLIKYWRERV